MTKSKKSSAADEMLRQSVFSSIHLSSRLKCDIVQLFTPLCSNCGVNKASSKKKPGSYYLSIYTNKSEPFVVWCKKREDPKGILWLRNYAVRKSSNDCNEIELVSKGCPFKCTHKIKLANSNRTSEWYQLLRDESRRQPSISDVDIHSESFLDSILDNSSHRNFFGEEEDSKLDLVESDSETISLSSSVDSEDKISLDCSVDSSSPVQNCNSIISYLKGSRGRNLTTSILPHLPKTAKETKKMKSTSLLLSPQHQQKLPPVSPQLHRKPLTNCDYNAETDLAERWSWPTHKQ